MKELEKKVKLEAVTDDLFPEIFKETGLDYPFMKKGWKTWTTAHEILYSKNNCTTVLIENNKYLINFNMNAFKTIKN